MANSEVPDQGPPASLTVLPPSSAPIVVLSSTGPPSEPEGDGSSSEVDEDNPQPVLRLRGGSPEELDDEDAVYEQDQNEQPVTGLRPTDGKGVVKEGGRRGKRRVGGERRQQRKRWRQEEAGRNGGSRQSLATAVAMVPGRDGGL